MEPTYEASANQNDWITSRNGANFHSVASVSEFLVRILQI